MIGYYRDPNGCDTGIQGFGAPRRPMVGREDGEEWKKWKGETPYEVLVVMENTRTL